MWVSVAGWEVRRLWSGGGGSVLRNKEGGGMRSGRGGRGCSRRAERCGGWVRRLGLEKVGTPASHPAGNLMWETCHQQTAHPWVP